MLTCLEGRGHEILRETLVVFIHIHLGHGEPELGQSSSLRVLRGVIKQEQDLYGHVLNDFAIYQVNLQVLSQSILFLVSLFTRFIRLDIWNCLAWKGQVDLINEPSPKMALGKIIQAIRRSIDESHALNDGVRLPEKSHVQ